LTAYFQENNYLIIVATRSHIFIFQDMMHQIRLRLGLCTRPRSAVYRVAQLARGQNYFTTPPDIFMRAT